MAVLGNGELKRPIEQINELIKMSGLPVWVSANIHATRGQASWKKDFRWKGPKSGAEFVIASWAVPPSPGEIDFKKVGYDFKLKMQKPDLFYYEKTYPKTPILWAPHQDWDSDLQLAKDICTDRVHVNSLAILHAHTHVVRSELNHCIPIYEAGSFAEGLNRLEFSKQGGEWKLLRYDMISLGTESPEDSEVKSKVDELYRSLAPEANESVGTLPAAVSEEAVAQWLSQAYKKAGKADVSIINGGAVKLGLEAGNVSRERLLTSLPYNNDLMGLDWSWKDFERSLCSASRREKNEREDYGSQLYLSGVNLVNAGQSDCHLEGPRKASVKVVMDNFLVKRSSRWLGKNIESIAFKFGLTTEQAMNFVIKKEGLKF